jgi:predicted phosphate transport protein (TIGR00153 family)
MFAWFRRLMPREEGFFALFTRHADIILLGAREMQGMLAGGPSAQTHYGAVLAAEDAADAVTREVVQAVRRSFITPFDREDILALIGRMDDTLDQMKKTAKALSLYGLTDFGGEARSLGASILQGAELLREAVPLLASIGPNATRINLLCERIRQVEGEADEVHDAGVAALYRQAAPEGALAFIAAREILDQLEKVVDRFDDAANAIEGIVVEQV